VRVRILYFYLERLNNVENENKSWVADQATGLIRHNEEIFMTGLEIINNVKSLRKQYIKTGVLY